MSDIKVRQEKIRDKIKSLSFDECLKKQFCRNSLVFYKEDGVISKYKKTDRIKGIIDYKIFEANRDNLTKHGIEYNTKKNFFENFGDLYKNMDLPNVLTFGGTENADFSDVTISSKNIYLSSTVVNSCENVLYSMQVKDFGVNVLNSLLVWSNNENIYMSTGIIKSFNIFYSKYIYNCSNVWFSANLTGCSECILCENLENASYCIQNEEYNKEAYLIKKQEILSQKEKFLDHYKGLSNVGNNIASNDIKNGSFVLYSSNIENGYLLYQVKNGRNLVFAGGIEGDEEMYNCLNVGSPASNHFYGVVNGGVYSENIYCCYGINGNCSNIYYSFFMEGCSYCLGCVGLKNKQFCIFNKEYTQKKRYKMVDDIFQKMADDNSLGEYFPGWLNPYYFNDTVAYLIDSSFTKEEILKEGYLWRDEEIKVDIPSGADVVGVKDLDHYQGYEEEDRTINPEILKKVIKDEEGNYYKIMPMELEFLQKYGLPLPEIHRLERIKLGFKFK